MLSADESSRSPLRRGERVIIMTDDDGGEHPGEVIRDEEPDAMVWVWAPWGVARVLTRTVRRTGQPASPDDTAEHAPLG